MGGDPGERWEPEALRAEALEALGRFADPRATAVLQSAELHLAPAESGWDLSAGHVEGHGVTLRVDAATLGRLRAAPALVDALQAAVASAIARRPGQALSHLHLRWARDGGHAIAQGYRDRPPDPPPTLGAAFVAYLEALGESVAASVVARAAVSLSDSVVHVVVTAAVRAELRRAGPRASEALSLAARDLTGDPEARAVIVA